jgi:hypothetical protein
VAQSANRALGLLIAKFKILGGMPYNVYTKLFDSMVWYVVSTGLKFGELNHFLILTRVRTELCVSFLV